MANYLAKATYRCTTDEGVEYRLNGILVEHGGFDYGNGHAIVIWEDGFSETLLDARYDGRFSTKEGFYQHIMEVFKDYYNISDYELISES